MLAILFVTATGLAQTADSSELQKGSELVACIAKIMKLPLPPTEPVIRQVSQVDIEKIAGGFASVRARGGAPVGLYIPPGIIFISKSARPDDIAHEMAHHFQFHNQPPTQGEAAEDEAEAVRRDAASSCL
jgi:hypothetical protein